MKILELRKKTGNDRPLKAFVDVELDNGIIIRDFRIIQYPDRRPTVVSPQTSFKDGSGEIKYRTIITFPDQMKGEIDLIVLSEWNREREKQNGSSPVG